MSLLAQQGLLLADETGPVGHAVWDSTKKSTLIVLLNGGRTAARSGEGVAWGAPYASVRANIGKSAGRWYFEISSALDSYSGNAEESGGIVGEVVDITASTSAAYIGISTPSAGYCFRRGGGGGGHVQEVRNGAAGFLSGGAVRPNDGYMGVAVDLDAGRAWCVINGVWVGGSSPTASPLGRYTFAPGTRMYPAVSVQSGIESRPEALYTLNAGQDAFKNVSPSDFESGGVLAGFNAGWFN